MQIPRVSPFVAQQINKEFKTLKNLLYCLEKDKECLNNIVCTLDGKRKISKSTIKNIQDFLN